MAKLPQGVMGPFIGRLGTVVGYVWNRQRVVFLLSQGATIIMLSLICTGIAGILETVFDLMTNARLYELSNLNHPLLRRLMQNAPGTYQHSIAAATLAENAAYETGLISISCYLRRRLSIQAEKPVFPIFK